MCFRTAMPDVQRGRGTVQTKNSPFFVVFLKLTYRIVTKYDYFVRLRRNISCTYSFAISSPLQNKDGTKMTPKWNLKTHRRDCRRGNCGMGFSVVRGIIIDRYGDTDRGRKKGSGCLSHVRLCTSWRHMSSELYIFFVAAVPRLLLYMRLCRQSRSTKIEQMLVLMRLCHTVAWRVHVSWLQIDGELRTPTAAGREAAGRRFSAENMKGIGTGDGGVVPNSDGRTLVGAAATRQSPQDCLHYI